MLADNPITHSHKRRISKAAREHFREELLNIARQILQNEGHAAVTIRRITNEAGVTPMAFYWYFDCKEALLTVIWDEIILEATQFSSQKAQNSPQPEKELAYCEAQIEFWSERPEHFRAVFLNEAQHDDVRHLRHDLQKMAGAQQTYRDLGDALCSKSNSLPHDVRRKRIALVIYRLIGFLHSIVDMHNVNPSKLAQWRQWMREDLALTFDHWRTASS